MKYELHSSLGLQQVQLKCVVLPFTFISINIPQATAKIDLKQRAQRVMGASLACKSE